jgi:hypothetical protein
MPYGLKLRGVAKYDLPNIEDIVNLQCAGSLSEARIDRLQLNDLYGEGLTIDLREVTWGC